MVFDVLSLNKAGGDTRNFFRFLGVSAACHFAVFLILVFAKGDAPIRRIRPGAIHVDLVSLPAPSGKARVKTGSITPVRKKTRSKKKTTVKKKKVRVSARKKKKKTRKKVVGKKRPKRSLKKKTVGAEKKVEKAIEEMKKKVAQSPRSEVYNKTMERLAKQVASQTDSRKGTGNRTSSNGYGHGIAYQRSELLTVYAAEIYSRISKNWSFNEQFANGRKDLEALLGIRIMADGEIRDVWFDRKSGNRYFDEQARKAVLKTGYLPHLPEGWKKPYLEIGLRFTPSGLQ